MRLIWTDAGYAALVNPENTGTNAVRCSHIAVGRGTTPATRADTALENEIKRVSTISGQAVDSDIIHVVLRDETSDVYGFTEFGLIADDGTLLARYAQTETIIEKAAGSTALLPIDATLTDVDATQIVFPSAEFVNPPWGENTQGVLARATQALAIAGEDNLRGMSPLRTFQAIAAWLDAEYPGAGGGIAADTVDGAHLADIVALINTVLTGTGEDPNTTKKSLILSNHENTPDAGATAWFLKTIVLDANPLRREQTATRYANESARFYRALVSNSGVWGPWIRLLDSQQVQVSPTDTTAGALMTLGAFGLGSTDESMPLITDFDNRYPTGTYRFLKDTPNSPTSDGGCAFVAMRGGNVSAQIAVPFTAGGLYYRAQNSTGWEDWSRVWDTENQGHNSGMDADTVDGLHAQKTLTDSGDKLMRVGAFGLGNDSFGNRLTDANDTTMRSGLYHGLTGSTTPMPPGTGSNDLYSILVIRNSAFASQLWINQRYKPGYAYLRTLNNGSWSDFIPIWTGARQGPGSGMDADTVDGEHASDLRNAANLNAGILPIARLLGEYGISITGNAGTATRASDADDAAKLGGIEAAAYRLNADHILPTNAHAHADQIDAYPVGVSVMYQRGGDGWPSQAGSVLTVRPDEANAGYQEYTNGTGDNGESKHFQMTRIYYASAGVWGGWQLSITYANQATTLEYGIARRASDFVARQGENSEFFVTPSQIPVHRKSGQFNFADTSILQLPHGMNRAPDQAWAQLVCATADRNYRPGQVAYNWRIHDNNGASGPPLVVSDHSYIEFLCGDHAVQVLWYERTATADWVSVNRSNWRVVLHGVWYS